MVAGDGAGRMESGRDSDRSFNNRHDPKMKTLPPEISDMERAVHAYKHEQIVRVMAKIICFLKSQDYVSPGDIPEDIVEREHRQGVCSNAWNSLVALEIIERLPMNFTNELHEIFGGRKKNKNDSAKSRWTSAYRLKSRTLADAWLRANKQPVDMVVPELQQKFFQ